MVHKGVKTSRKAVGGRGPNKAIIPINKPVSKSLTGKARQTALARRKASTPQAQARARRAGATTKRGGIVVQPKNRFARAANRRRSSRATLAGKRIPSRRKQVGLRLKLGGVSKFSTKISPEKLRRLF